MKTNDLWKEKAGNNKRKQLLSRTYRYRCAALLIMACLMLRGCAQNAGSAETTGSAESTAIAGNAVLSENTVVLESTTDGQKPDVDCIPAYCGKPYYGFGAGPSFTDGQYEAVSGIQLSELDDLGRCGAAEMKITYDTLATEERGQIGHVKPSGWHTVKYPEVIAELYLYNRCHLLAYSLSGLNDENRNLITGTRYLNVEGMLPFEQQVLEYVRSTKDGVLYRVTPVYKGDNLVCDGVLMEAASCDRGKLEFAVYCYNVQPGVIIDYATGASHLEDVSRQSVGETVPAGSDGLEISKEQIRDYVVNTNTGRFHKPSCTSVGEMKPSNRMDYQGTAEELEKQGYEPCKRCRPDEI